MPTKSELQARVTNSIRAFQSFMPPLRVAYPSVIISTQRTSRVDRALLISQTGSTTQSRGTDEVMELIAGPKGSAILVYKERVPDLDLFVKYLWATLGEFYVFSAVPEKKASRAVDDTMTPAEKLWHVFAPEAIAYHVDNQFRASHSNYHPEKIEWREDQWRPVYDSITQELYHIYGKKGIDIWELAHFLAWLLVDDMMTLYTSAVCEGRVDGAPNWMDKVPTAMQPSLSAMIAILTEQMKKEQFWMVEDDILGRVEKELAELNSAYVELIADELILDEVDAAPIPKELPDLDEDLPEID